MSNLSVLEAVKKVAKTSPSNDHVNYNPLLIEIEEVKMCILINGTVMLSFAFPFFCGLFLF